MPIYFEYTVYFLKNDVIRLRTSVGQRIIVRSYEKSNHRSPYFAVRCSNIEQLEIISEASDHILLADPPFCVNRRTSPKQSTKKKKITNFSAPHFSCSLLPYSTRCPEISVFRRFLLTRAENCKGKEGLLVVSLGNCEVNMRALRSAASTMSRTYIRTILRSKALFEQ